MSVRRSRDRRTTSLSPAGEAEQGHRRRPMRRSLPAAGRSRDALYAPVWPLPRAGGRIRTSTSRVGRGTRALPRRASQHCAEAHGDVRCRPRRTEGRVMARICLLNGVHTPGSDWEKECPVLRAQRRQEAKNADARVVVAGSPEPPSTPARSRRVGGHRERVPRIRLEKEPQGRLRWCSSPRGGRQVEKQ